MGRVRQKYTRQVSVGHKTQPDTTTQTQHGTNESFAFTLFVNLTRSLVARRHFEAGAKDVGQFGPVPIAAPDDAVLPVVVVVTGQQFTKHHLWDVHAFRFMNFHGDAFAVVFDRDLARLAVNDDFDVFHRVVPHFIVRGVDCGSSKAKETRARETQSARGPRTTQRQEKNKDVPKISSKILNRPGTKAASRCSMRVVSWLNNHNGCNGVMERHKEEDNNNKSLLNANANAKIKNRGKVSTGRVNEGTQGERATL